MLVARHRWFAWLLAAAVALLPLHASVANAAVKAAAAEMAGDCHGGKQAPEADAPCTHCGTCHAVQAEPAMLIADAAAVTTPPAAALPRLIGRALQPDLHPPLA